MIRRIDSAASLRNLPCEVHDDNKRKKEKEREKERKRERERERETRYTHTGILGQVYKIF